AVFFAAVLSGAAPPSTASPTFTASESASRVAATVLVFLVASSATSGETRVTLVIVAFRRRKYTGRARGHHSLLRKEGSCARPREGLIPPLTYTPRNVPFYNSLWDAPVSKRSRRRFKS